MSENLFRNAVARGSVEGFIESLHRKKGQPFTCSVYDQVYRRSIVCTFTKAELEDQAYRSFRPPKRVLVHGLIRYAKEGHPVRIDADLIRAFPDDSDLPAVEDIQEIYKK